jgi:hypothetical protein
MISRKVHPRSHNPFFIPCGKPGLHLFDAANVVRILDTDADTPLIHGKCNSQHTLPYLVLYQSSSVLFRTLVLTPFIPFYQEVVEVSLERHNHKLAQTFRGHRLDLVVFYFDLI